MDTTTCPECGAPAEVIDRFALESTDGPIEHVRVQCVAWHWFLLSTESLARHRAAAAGPTVAAPRGPDQHEPADDRAAGISSRDVPRPRPPARRWR
jgi:hypothetical protein